ncbi:uncharacterized protein LOC115756272 [Rhodamnia argentea]|uniref:Uncharacterized protein LOC115756272 n=1 Tax=Rhodamnia argentea TaxID=178133 RepID=A0A8B8QXN0_9MYRT|nr:uncharacterized protein LOC115756272 [Rhodamnia argentea]
MKSKWGIPRFMPLKTFINPLNGYLVDDTCVFRVEVFVAKSLGLGECLTLKASPNSVCHEWKISNFSTLGNECYSEEVKSVSKGCWAYLGRKPFDFLCLADSADETVKATYAIRLKGKDGKMHQRTGSNWFNGPNKGRGWPSLPLKTVQNYLVGDVCVVEPEVKVLGTVELLYHGQGKSADAKFVNKNTVLDLKSLHRFNFTAHNSTIRCFKPLSGITTEYTDVSPAHYVFKIKSFSLFSDNGMDIYETNDFESGGHKWRLILYPNGDKSRNGEGHVSIYLAVSETSPLKVGSDVNAIVRFFVFDQIRDVYLVKQGSSTRFRAMRSKWGIPRFVPLENFKDQSNGYLVDDTCVFGVEVFVIKNSGIGECLRLKKGTSSHTHEWKIPNFSSLVEESCYSKIFIAGDQEWKVRLYPRGDWRERNKSLSIFLVLVDSKKLAPQVSARYSFRLRGQDGAVHEGPKGSRWFGRSSSSWGWSCFMLLERVRDFLVNDECVVEAEVTVLGTSGKLT